MNIDIKDGPEHAILFAARVRKTYTRIIRQKDLAAKVASGMPGKTNMEIAASAANWIQSAMDKNAAGGGVEGFISGMPEHMRDLAAMVFGDVFLEELNRLSVERN